ncbi:hypothetical protein K443DRAFT_81605, partial [Laccaria amethystina LaAM-08-1]
GHPEYGCFISKEKTLTNFDYDSQILNVVDPLQRCKLAFASLLISDSFNCFGRLPMVWLSRQYEGFVYFCRLFPV